MSHPAPWQLLIHDPGRGDSDPKFKVADLGGARLNDAHLTGADFGSAHLNDAHLTGANLTGADLTGANPTGADLTSADLTLALWPPDEVVPEGWRRDNPSRRLKRAATNSSRTPRD